MNTQEHFSDLLPATACQEALEWCRTQPDLPTAWATCQRGDWMAWLLNELQCWPAGSQAEYRRAFWAEYERALAPAWAEYKRALALAQAEYERATAPALAEYKRATAAARAEYDRALALAQAEYDRATADCLRSLVPTAPELSRKD